VEFRPTLPIALNAFRRLTSPPSRKMEDALMMPSSSIEARPDPARGERVEPAERALAVRALALRPVERSALPPPPPPLSEPHDAEPAEPARGEPAKVACPEPADTAGGGDSAWMSTEQEREAGAILDTLRWQVRRRLLRTLIERGPANVGALVAAVGQPQTTVSHHLSKLKDKRLVHDERRGKEVWYTADPRRVRLEPNPPTPVANATPPANATPVESATPVANATPVAKATPVANATALTITATASDGEDVEITLRWRRRPKTSPTLNPEP
jgi:ArsR family transcriptional regulator